MLRLHEIRHNYTEFVVEHTRGLKAIGIAALIGALPSGVVSEVFIAEHTGPVTMLTVGGLGAIALSLSVGGREIANTKDVGQQG